MWVDIREEAAGKVALCCLMACFFFFFGLTVMGVDQRVFAEMPVLVEWEPVDNERLYRPQAEDTDQQMSRYWWTIVEALYDAEDGQTLTFYLSESQQAVPAGVMRTLRGREVVLKLVEPSGNSISIAGLNVPEVPEERSFYALDVVRYTYDKAGHESLYWEQNGEQKEALDAQKTTRQEAGVSAIDELGEKSILEESGSSASQGSAADGLEQSSLKESEYTTIEKPQQNVNAQTQSPSTFDAFDEEDKIIVGERTRSYSTMALPSVSEKETSLPQETSASKEVPVRVESLQEPAMEITLGTMSYLVISVALLIPLGAGLLTHSLLRKKGRKR